MKRRLSLEESAEAARRGRAWFAHARVLQWEAFDAFDAKDYEKAERLAIESQDAFKESGVCPMPAPIEGGEPS